jgi:CBS domain-containing protein
VLQRFGYPECPGHIMLNNPEWRGSVSDFGQRAREWLLMPSADSLMRLAIFLDAHAVAGDAALLAGVRQQLQSLATDNDALIARFASVIDSFGESGGWWNRLLGRSDAFSSVHLKKAGIFPLVHGVRSLALARHVDTTSTVDRIEALVADGTLDAPLGREMRESLHLLMGLRLQAGLSEIERHRPVTGEVDPSTLSSLERDLLKDALAVVRRFRTLLQQRLRLDAL